ncbi:TrgA family protein [Thalassovita gelatinovora]|nr:TrgA family protein [Thalassovita gelatinovora]
MLRPLMPESTVFGWFNYVNTALGLIIGWRMIGAKAGAGLVSAISNGITAIVGLVFFGLFVHALNEMLRLSMRRAYQDPLQGIEDMFRIGAEYGALVLNPNIALILIAGGVAIAIITEVINSVWR